MSLPEGEPKSSSERDREAARLYYFQQIVDGNTKNPWVRKAARKVTRSILLPPLYAGSVYEDDVIPIEGAYISQPSIVFGMMDHLQLDGTGSILEVGTGSGWLALLLAECAQTVHTIDISQTLVAKAEEIARTIGNTSIHFHVGDGAGGLPDHSPFQGIIVTAAVMSIATELVMQLDENGGKLVIPVGENYAHCTLVVGTRYGNEFEAHGVGPVKFMPLMSEKKGGWTQAVYDEVTKKNEDELSEKLEEIARAQDLNLEDLRRQIREHYKKYAPLKPHDINQYLMNALEEMGVVAAYVKQKLENPENPHP